MFFCIIIVTMIISYFSSETLCEPLIPVLSVMQVLYLVGFVLFTVESLMSIWVLEV
jgi:hypothetical protein